MKRAARRRRRWGKAEQHVRLHHWLLNTPAYKALTPPDRAVLVEIMRRYNGSNNGRIGLGVREAAEACGVSKNTAARAFDNLQEKGFIFLTTDSNFHRKNRLAREWALTEFANDATGEPPSKAFIKWRPEKSEHSPI